MTWHNMTWHNNCAATTPVKYEYNANVDATFILQYPKANRHRKANIPHRAIRVSHPALGPVMYRLLCINGKSMWQGLIAVDCNVSFHISQSSSWRLMLHIDGLIQEICNSIANVFLAFTHRYGLVASLNNNKSNPNSLKTSLSGWKRSFYCVYLCDHFQGNSSVYTDMDTVDKMQTLLCNWCSRFM